MFAETIRGSFHKKEGANFDDWSVNVQSKLLPGDNGRDDARYHSLTRAISERIRHGAPLFYQLFFRSRLPEFVSYEQATFSGARRYNVSIPSVVPTPDVPTMPFRADAAYLKGDWYFVPEDYIAILDGVRYVSAQHVILTDNNKILESSSNARRLKHFTQRDFFWSERYVEGYSTVWRSRFHNYYHLLVDVLPRLLTIEHLPEYDSIDEIKLLTTKALTPNEAYLLSKLNLERLRPVVVEPPYLYRMEHLVFSPLKTRGQAGYLPSAYVNRLRELLLPDRPSRKNRRIFISRQRGRRRKIRNWEEVLHALDNLGFEWVAFETFPIQEQIEMAYDADVIVGVHGAGLTNMLFAPYAKIVELFPTPDIAPHYFYLSRSLGLEYAFVLGREDDLSPEWFDVDVEALLRTLDRLELNSPTSHQFV
jgi:hypothetical protein